LSWYFTCACLQIGDLAYFWRYEFGTLNRRITQFIIYVKFKCSEALLFFATHSDLLTGSDKENISVHYESWIF